MIFILITVFSLFFITNYTEQDYQQQPETEQNTTITAIEQPPEPSIKLENSTLENNDTIIFNYGENSVLYQKITSYVDYNNNQVWIGSDAYSGNLILIQNEKNDIFGYTFSIFGSYKINKKASDSEFSLTTSSPYYTTETVSLEKQAQLIEQPETNPQQATKPIIVYFPYNLNYLTATNLTEEQFLLYNSLQVAIANTTFYNMGWSEYYFTSSGPTVTNLFANYSTTASEIEQMILTKDETVNELLTTREEQEADLMYFYGTMADNNTTLNTTQAVMVDSFHYDYYFALELFTQNSDLQNYPTNFIHEVGHLLGGWHSTNEPLPPTLEYAYNKADTYESAGTILSYQPNILLYFSSPDYYYDGSLKSAAMGDQQTNNKKYFEQPTIDNSTRLENLHLSYEHRDYPSALFPYSNEQGKYLVEEYIYQTTTVNNSYSYNLNDIKVYDPDGGQVQVEIINEVTNFTTAGYYEPIIQLTDDEGNKTYIYTYLLITE